MTRIHRVGILAAALVAAPVLEAQEPWESSFKLVAASGSGRESAGLGQNQQFGLSLAGVHYLSAKGSICLEGGYQYAPASTRTAGGKQLEDSRDAYHVGALYRHDLFVDGFSLQAGLRLASAMATSRVSAGTGTWVRENGPRHMAVNPVVGMAGRLTQKLGLEANATRLAVKDLQGTVHTGTQVELALAIHFGK